MEGERKQVSGCTPPGAQLTHPNSFIAIIIAFLSLLLSAAFSIPLAWSHSSKRCYRMTSQRATCHCAQARAHTHTQERRPRPQYLHIFFSFSPSEKLFFLSLKRSDKDFTLETDGSCWLLLSCSEVLKVNQKRRLRFTSA